MNTPIDLLVGVVLGVSLACVVLLPQRRRRGERAEVASEDVATALRRSKSHGSAQDAGRMGGSR